MGRLVIDLGHGASDPGAVGQNGTHESNVVLAIGKELNESLKGYDLEVKFTRLSDKYLSLGERVKIANDFKADYFLSIHINSASDKSVRGSEIWIYDNVNSRMNNFTKGLCEDISKIFNIRNRGVKFNKEFTVLRDTRMPACLVEIDFISNKDAEKDLKVSGNIKAVAAAIKDNLIDLFGLKKPDNDILYKVCVGAYRDKNNALNQVKIARDKGFKDAYII
ncbi:MAG: N-acetylmuramoyl-L-alanine amidase [Peptostreptococcaceae bacterium]